MQRVRIPAPLTALAGAAFWGLLGCLPPPGSAGQDPPRSPASPSPSSASGAPAELVALECRVSHPLALAGEARDVWVHVALEAAELPALPRPGLNLALVIDRSGSMGSEDKLEHAKSAAEQLVGRLREDDRLAVVAYDDAVRTVVPSTAAGDRGAFRDAIRALTPGGSTDLEGGLARGVEEVLRNADGERLNRVLLLSDGLANRGVTDPRAVAEHASGFRARGAQVSTMGMGLAYDEDLLVGIAQRAGGAYYYVDDPEAVGAHLDRELDQLTRVVARELDTRLELGPGVEFVELYGYAYRRDGDALVVPMSDLASGERRKAVLQLRVRGEVDEETAILRARLGYRAAGGGERFAVESAAPLVLFTTDVAAVEAAADGAVLVHVEVVRNAVALDEAMRLRKAGRLEDAQALLAARYRNSKTFNDTELHSVEVTRLLFRIRQTMLDLERTRSDPAAARDLQLSTQLRALGYLSSG